MTIREIELLTYEKAKEFAIEELNIKGHTCLIAHLGEYFGYSILVFKNGKHIYYANDYELHHTYMAKEKGREGLKELYIESLNQKLYTDEELMESVSSYFEYDKKNHFLRNYWIMRYDYDSIFGINKEIDKKRFPYYNPVAFCYVADKSIVDESLKYCQHLADEYEKLKENNEEFRKMIRYELCNHEAGYTGTYKDALESLDLKFDELSEEKQNIVTEELRILIDRN